MAYILPDPAQTTSSGWECPRCRRVWSPSVLACHHCPGPAATASSGSFTAMSLIVPAVMTRPGGSRHACVTREWAEVWPGLQFRHGGWDAENLDRMYIEFRLTPAENAP